MVSALITVAVIAWCAQLALGGWQISRFNRAFDLVYERTDRLRTTAKNSRNYRHACG